MPRTFGRFAADVDPTWARVMYAVQQAMRRHGDRVVETKASRREILHVRRAAREP